jgi:hypothetical protein
LSRYDEVHQSPNANDNRGPDIEPKTQNGVGIVNAKGFDPHSAGAVQSDIQREKAPVAHRETAICPDQNHSHGNQP